MTKGENAIALDAYPIFNDGTDAPSQQDITINNNKEVA